MERLGWETTSIQSAAVQILSELKYGCVKKIRMFDESVLYTHKGSNSSFLCLSFEFQQLLNQKVSVVFHFSSHKAIQQFMDLKTATLIICLMQHAAVIISSRIRTVETMRKIFCRTF